jgi:outer membrane protein OmpA-like peptidoglycan-associated protein
VQRKRRERIADRFIDRYALILFDFDKADIHGANRRIVDLINGNIQDASHASVEGYTDRIGDAAYNRDLSFRRASEVGAALRAGTHEVHAHGEDVLLYDNDLPEGRTYSRTVIVTVETPVGYEK